MPVSRILRATLAAVALAAVAACGKNASTPTSASSTTTTTTVAAPAYTAEFNGTVPVGGASFYSFTVTQYGTVNLRLNSVSGQFVPSTVTMALGLGVPDGTDCVTSTTVNVQASASVHITGAYAAGVYCAKVTDVGNLFAPAKISVTIEYP